jgi:hypothetical protein
MSNFYDFLQVYPSATDVEIENAIDAMYNESRRKVTHHDPQVVHRANQNLLLIEQARTTLLDPVKRVNYDASLSPGKVGGLADETAKPASTSMTFPHKGSQPSQQLNPNTDMWLCSKCHSINPVGTRFCEKCGNQLGKDCPKCRNLLEASTHFCSSCGVNVGEYERELEIHTAEAEAQRIAERKRLNQIEATLGPVRKNAETASTMMKTGCIVGFFLSIVGIPFWIISIINAQKVLSAGQVYGDTEYREKAKRARLFSGIPLILLGIILLLYIGLFVLTGFVSILEAGG